MYPLCQPILPQSCIITLWHTYRTQKNLPLLQLLILFAVLYFVIDSLVSLSHNLGLEVEVYQLILLWIPLAIGVSVIDNLTAAYVSNFDGGVRKRAVGRPLQLVAAISLYRKRLGASGLSVLVDALLHGKVEHAAFDDSIAA